MQRRATDPAPEDASGGQIFSILAGVWVLLALVLTVQASRVGTFSGDVQVTNWVQTVSAPGVNAVVSFLNWLGRPIPLISLTVVLSAALALRRRYLEIALLVSTGFVHVVNALIKSAAASPRPTADTVRVADQASGFGFPSGHTMAAVVFCGVCLFIAWKLTDRTAIRFTATALAVAVMLGMGFSRVHVGAHWPTDVLGAYLWGAMYVVILIALYQRLRSALTPAGSAV